MNVETKVQEEILTRLEELQGLDPASDEYKAVVEAIATLIDRKIKIEEIHIKEKEISEAHKNQIWDRILRGAAILVPPTTALLAGFALSVLERTENVTSTPAREFVKRALRLS